MQSSSWRCCDVYPAIVRQDEALHAGCWACPALQRASKSTDPGNRSTGALEVPKQISEKSSPELLRLKEEDVISSNDRVHHRLPFFRRRSRPSHPMPPSNRATCARCTSANNTTPASCLSMPPSMAANRASGSTPASFSTRTFAWSLSFTAKLIFGRKLLASMSPDPRATTPWARGPIHGRLVIGRIGENGKPFLVGDRFESSVGEEGKLFLHIVPSPWSVLLISVVSTCAFT